MFTTGDTSVADGTHLLGTITTTRSRIEIVFGPPTIESNDDSDKVTTEWIISFNDGTVATIYDWKRYESGPVGMSETYDWRIGGHDSSVVTRVEALLPR